MSWFLERLNKIDKHLGNFTKEKKKRKGHKVHAIMSEKDDITKHPAEIRIINTYFKNLIRCKTQMRQTDSYNYVTKVNKKDRNTQNKQISANEIEDIIRNLPK